MRKLKRTAGIAIVAVGLSTGHLHAQQPENPATAPVTIAVPQDQSPFVAPPLPDRSDFGIFSGLYFSGEFIYLKPHRDNAQTGVLTNSPTPGEDSVKNVNWGFTPGIRIGTGYAFGNSGWDVGATYTYLHSTAQRTVIAPPGSILEGTLTSNPLAKDATSSDSDAGLSYNVVDLDVRKHFQIDPSFTLSGFAGVRIASIEQSLKSIYTGGALGGTADFVNSPVHFEGAGLTTGAQADWNIWRGLGIYGRARVGLVSGHFHSRQMETIGGVQTENTTDRFETVVPVAELGAGLRYQTDHMFISAGYELTDWFNMVNGLTPPVIPGQVIRSRSDLTLEGMNIKLGFTF